MLTVKVNIYSGNSPKGLFMSLKAHLQRLRSFAKLFGNGDFSPEEGEAKTFDS